MKIAGRIFRKIFFSFCGKLNVYGVYSCSGNSDTDSTPLKAFSPSVAPHPRLVRPKTPVIFRLLFVPHLYPLAVFLLIRTCPLWLSIATASLQILTISCVDCCNIFLSSQSFFIPSLNLPFIIASLCHKGKHITPFAQTPLVTALYPLYTQASAP